MTHMDKKATYNTWYWVAAFAGVMLIQYFWAASQQVEPLPYSQFRTMVREGKIAEVRIGPNGISGEFKTPLPDGRRYFTTRQVPDDLADELDKQGVRYTGVAENTLLRDILSWVVPILVFFGLWAFLFRRFADKAGFGGGLMSVGKSRAKVYVEADTKVTFADVAGVDEAKDELKEIVDFLKEPERYGRLGARIPKGILLVGPPGTGKTLLARAVAGEAGVPFFSISGSEFVEMFVGVGAARVRDLFEQARKQAPAIVFIDELDALGRARGAFPGIGGHDEKEQTLNQLLVEMDGFDVKSGLVLLSATNRPEILDPALLRAGRFDRQVLVDRPDKIGRVQILDVHLKKVTLAADVDREKIAAMTPGFTGADLANLVNEAALLATRRSGSAVALEDFTQAVERIVAGLEKRNRILNPKERRTIAYHEMGHALVALSLPGSDPVHKVSIIPRGVGALGYTIQRPLEDRFLMDREELEHKMMVLLGGRAAEHIVFDRLSTGAADDLQKVTDIAKSIVMRYGMNESLGQVVYQREQRNFLSAPGMPSPTERDYSEATAERIDAAVRGIIDEAFARTVQILTSRRPALERGAAELLQHETLNEADLLAIAGGAGAAPA